MEKDVCVPEMHAQRWLGPVVGPTVACGWPGAVCRQQGPWGTGGSDARPWLWTQVPSTQLSSLAQAYAQP